MFPPMEKFLQTPMERSRDAGTGVHYGGTAPCPLKGGATGAQVPLRISIISNFMIY